MTSITDDAAGGRVVESPSFPALTPGVLFPVFSLNSPKTRPKSPKKNRWNY